MTAFAAYEPRPRADKTAFAAYEPRPRADKTAFAAYEPRPGADKTGLCDMIGTDEPGEEDESVFTLLYWYDDEPADEDEQWAHAGRTPSIVCARRSRVIRNRESPFVSVAVTKSLLRRVARLILAVVVLCGAFQAGAHYFYCEALGLSSSDPCAQSAEHRERCPFDAIDRRAIDCCSVITMPSMPDGTRGSGPSVAPAGVVAVLPAIQDANASWWSERPRESRAHDCHRKPPRSSGQRRAELMVFLT